ncbi:imm11 family protein [Roseospira navarrensis]|uniref:imm11 family protein n=1 Tax=Roseospira navarrensis TaxID=140058 RepID=UPI003CCC9F77
MSLHQFFPISLEWEYGSIAGHRYWFNPCHRLDSVDRNATTVKKDGTWKIKEATHKRLAFNKQTICNKHAWLDKFVSGHHVFISDQFKSRLLSSGLTGIKFGRHFEELD